MGLLNSIFGTSKSRFESEMANTAQQIMLSFGKIQEGMRSYLTKYAEANGMPLRTQVMENTFSWLISGLTPPADQIDLSRQYVEALKTSSIVVNAFATAINLKLNMMSAQGLMSESMKIVNNLNELRLPVFSIDMNLPSERAFIQMANDFYNACQTMSVPLGHSVQSPMVSSAPPVPPVEDRYVLRAELGRGGFGVVNKAYDRKLNREVAIKRLISNFSADENSQFRKRFEREAKVVATLNHPNIVQIYDYEDTPQGYRIVMEYVPDGSLSNLLEMSGGALSESLSVRFAHQIVAGLAHAHGKGVIHRDLKPQNILIEKSDGQIRAKIADFGIACVNNQFDSINTIGGLGTPLYMAPEQRVNAKSVSEAADIYALGKMLYQMFTGIVGLEMDVDRDLLPDGWGELIEQCTRREPERRISSAIVLSNKVNQLAKGISYGGY